MGVFPDWLIQQRGIVLSGEPCEPRSGKISYGLTSYGYDARVGYKFKIFTNVWGSTVDPKNFDPKSFVDVDVTPAGCSWQVAYDTSLNNTTGWQCARCGNITEIQRNSIPPTKERCEKEAIPNYITIPPNSFALAETIEEFTTPRDCIAVCVGKSTYARCGIIVNVTPLEPEWKGKVTVEISNTTPLPAKVYAGEGIMQVLFFQSAGRNIKLLDLVYDWFLTRDFGMAGRMFAVDGSCQTSYADKKGIYQGQDTLTLPRVRE